jgi:hypothetical protein
MAAGLLEDFWIAAFNNVTSRCSDISSVAIERVVGYFESGVNVALQWPGVFSVLGFLTCAIGSYRQLTVSNLINYVRQF